MNANVLVSVIIPTYARNEQLERAIKSVQSQTYTNIEIIIVDDNPVDSEWRRKTELLMELFNYDSRIRYIKNAENLGGAGARNVGISCSRGKYLAFLDDDDYYYPTKIEKQLELFRTSENPKLALVYCYADYLNSKQNISYTYRENYRGNCLYEAILYDCIAATSRWMVKKECMNSIGNFSIVPSKQDSTVILKLLEAGYEIDCVEESLSAYDDSGKARISMGNLKNLEGQKLFINLCRRNYNHFSLEQILEIEFIFAYKLFWLSDNNGLKSERNRQIKNMFRCNTAKTVSYLFKYYLKRRRVTKR